jgi:hypothetical protein
MRETKEVILPSGLKVVMQTYVTGREVRAVSVLETEREKMIDTMVEFSVVSLNGSKENLKDTILDLPAKDYVAIIKEAQSLFEISDEKKSE